MAIYYDKEYNARIAREVLNFNKRRNRAIKNGYHNIPPRQLVSELKGRYEKRSDLERELKRLRNFSAKDTLKKVELSGGYKAVQWKYDFIKDNLNNTKDYLNREYSRIEKKVGKFPGERTQLDTIAAKLNHLDLDLAYLNEDEFRATYRIVREFATSPTKLKNGYRGFLSEVEFVINTLGYPEEKNKEFFDKFKALTPEQFLYAYDNNDIISRVYELYFKYDGEGQVTASDDAKEAIDTLLEEADLIIEEAKTKA